MAAAGVPPTEHVYRALIWCCGRHHRADRAQAAFDAMLAAGLAPGIATWSALLNAYADSAQPFRAVEALKRMRGQGLTPSVHAYGALAKAYARGGDWRRALEVLERMADDGVAPNEQVGGRRAPLWWRRRAERGCCGGAGEALGVHAARLQGSHCCLLLPALTQPCRHATCARCLAP